MYLRLHHPCFNEFPFLYVVGCKIKGLRAKTNTYIKTPMRIEEPVFVVTGRKEDVAEAKKEIMSAAEHFSQIRASRRNNNGGGSNSASTGLSLNPVSNGGPPTNCPGHITASLPVPLKEVGLVVGPKGATIKRIQQHTQTYIVTPGRDKKPIFEVTGLPENVEKACEEIRSYLDRRTGRSRDATINNSLNALSGSMTSLTNINTGLSNSMNSLNNSMNSLNTLTAGLGLGTEHEHAGDFHSNGISLDSCFHDIHADLLGSIFKPPSSNSAFTSYKHSGYNTDSMFMQPQQNKMPPPASDFNAFQAPPPPLPSTASLGAPPVNSMSSLPGLYDSDEGIGSPTYDGHSSLHPGHHTNSTSSIWGEFDSQSLSLFTPVVPQQNQRRQTSPPLVPSDPLSLMTGVGGNGGNNSSMFSSTLGPLGRGSSSSSSSPTDSTGSTGCCSSSSTRRTCMMCKDSDVVAALVPCGHNLMCMECAQTILDKPENQRRCPADGCMLPPQTAIRIFS